MSRLTIGTDPELMIWDKKLMKMVSSIPLLSTEKDDAGVPIPRDSHNPIDLGSGYKLYSDNVLVELSTPHGYGPVDFANIVILGLERAKDYISGIENGRYSVLAQASYDYDEDQLSHPVAKMVGCKPNFDAWARAMNTPVDFDSGLRTGSFHIHIGSEKLADNKAKEQAIRTLDLILGCSSVIFDKDITVRKRRKIYGRAGEFRPTEYGIEYRVLGNWPLTKRILVYLIGDLVSYSMDRLWDFEFSDQLRDKIKEAINDCSVPAAKDILKYVGMPNYLMGRIEADLTPRFIT